MATKLERTSLSAVSYTHLMAAKKGSLSISSENIFPIIKKWVYSDHDIFVREMVSNGCDAITKLKKLDVMGEYQLPDGYKPSIKVEVNPEEKTLKFTEDVYKRQWKKSFLLKINRIKRRDQ